MAGIPAVAKTLTTKQLTGLNSEILSVSAEEHKVSVASFGSGWDTGDLGPEAGGLNYPVDAYCTSEGQVLVLEKGASRLRIYSPEGQEQGFIGSAGHESGQMCCPSGFAVDEFAGLIYVADTLNHRIAVFNLQGAWLSSFGQMGDGEGELNGPVAVALGDTELHVVDKGNRRVQVFTPDGVFLRSYGSYGDAAGQFLCPTDIILDAAGNALVSDALTGTLQLFGRQGQLLDSLSLVGASGYPAGVKGISFGPNGELLARVA